MKQDIWSRFRFLIDRLPRVLMILRELYYIIFEGREQDLDLYLSDLHDTVRRRRQAITDEEKKHASQALADLISRL